MVDLKKIEKKKPIVEDTVVAIPPLEIKDPIDVPLKRSEPHGIPKFWYITGFLLVLNLLYFLLVYLIAILNISLTYKILSLVMGFLLLLDLLHSFKFLFKRNGN